MAHWELSAKHYQIRFYDDDPDAYVACLQLYVDGDKGFIHSLIGRGFYQIIPQFLPDVFKACGVKSVEGYVLERHAKFLERMMSAQLEVTRVGVGSVGSRKMVWLRIVLK